MMKSNIVSPSGMFRQDVPYFAWRQEVKCYHEVWNTKYLGWDGQTETCLGHDESSSFKLCLEIMHHDRTKNQSFLPRILFCQNVIWIWTTSTKNHHPSKIRQSKFGRIKHHKGVTQVTVSLESAWVKAHFRESILTRVHPRLHHHLPSEGYFPFWAKLGDWLQWLAIWILSSISVWF